MRNLKTLLAIVAVGLFGFAGDLRATVILDVHGSGILTGAENVNVNGTLYNVQFLDGTCATLFSGCDSNSDFTFTTSSDAQAAAQALLDQVFLDGLLGSFDANPALTQGCTDPSLCDAIVPYAFDTIDFFAGAAENRLAGGIPDDVALLFGPPGFDSSVVGQVTWAVFTPVSVPEPGSIYIFAFALLGLAFMGWCCFQRPTKRGITGFR